MMLFFKKQGEELDEMEGEIEVPLVLSWVDEYNLPKGMSGGKTVNPKGILTITFPNTNEVKIELNFDTYVATVEVVIEIYPPFDQLSHIPRDLYTLVGDLRDLMDEYGWEVERGYQWDLSVTSSGSVGGVSMKTVFVPSLETFTATVPTLKELHRILTDWEWRVRERLESEMNNPHIKPFLDEPPPYVKGTIRFRVDVWENVRPYTVDSLPARWNDEMLKWDKGRWWDFVVSLLTLHGGHEEFLSVLSKLAGRMEWVEVKLNSPPKGR
ncbi:MAG: hypothetical protein QW687_01000 [Candidatus Hadarchaeales archaeon]